jgi:hypothetical protein
MKKQLKETAAELRRLHDVNQELLQACQTFAEWLRREEEGFDLETHSLQTPEGKAAWRKWFYENLDICDLAQTQARAAIAKALERGFAEGVQKEWLYLTDEEVEQAKDDARRSFRRHEFSVRGQMVMPQDNYEWHLIRAIEYKLKEKNT